MKFHAPVGYYAEEQEWGNLIEVHLNVSFAYIPSGREETTDDILNYENLHRLVVETMSQPMLFLETAVSRILQAIQKRYPDLDHIGIKVSKLNPPLPGRTERVSVEEEWTQDR